MFFFPQRWFTVSFLGVRVSSSSFIMAIAGLNTLVATTACVCVCAVCVCVCKPVERNAFPLGRWFTVSFLEFQVRWLIRDLNAAAGV